MHKPHPTAVKIETMSTDNTNALQIHTHQAGITALGTTDHAFIELNLVDNSAEAARTAVTALADAINLPTTVGANVVVGVRPSLWAQVANPNDVPEGVHDFNAPIRGEDGYQMPATQKDAWIWVASASRSQTFNVAQHITKQLADNWKLSSETTGWVYEFNRDLTGFEDGTENPGALEAPGIVAIPNGQPGAGSSVLLYQLWNHRANNWYDLSTEEQEDIIGRTKADSVELDDETKPDSSHVARTVVEVDGEELDIYRRNCAYGDVRRHGTAFVGFSFDQWRLEEMLRQMAGVNGPRDMLTRFTDAISGAWYVCPSTQALASMLPEDEEED